MTMKRLLITGAAGALGSHCRQHVAHLVEERQLVLPGDALGDIIHVDGR